MEDLQVDTEWDGAFAEDIAIPTMRGGCDDTQRSPVSTSEPARPDLPSGEDDADALAKAPTSSLLAFRGVTGGVGVTSLAIEMAHVMAKSGRGDVCIIDLDFGSGMVSHYLDATVSPSLDDLRTEPHRLDRTFLQSLLFHHEAGFAVFASPGVMGGNDAVNTNSVLAALDTLANIFPVVILDVPRLTRPWTEAALKAADRVCLVSELTIPALHVTRQRIAALNSWGIPKTDVVLSKYERRSFKASIRKGDAERAIGQEVTGLLDLDPHVTVEAMNCGLPAGKVSRDSRYVKDVAALARELSPHFAERRSRERVTKRWGRRG